MRKITMDAAKAFREGVSFKRKNTQVLRAGYGMVFMRLHGRIIASYEFGSYEDTLRVSSGGWETNTTKERLNGLPGVKVHQKKYVWYLNGKEWTFPGTMTRVKCF